MTQQPQAQGPGQQRPGQMTAVMRAVMATGPKVLRIGLVQNGRVIEERIIKQRTHVTVGPSERSMFVVAVGNIPANFRLFELVGNQYALNFLDGMTGRVALPTGISDLNVLRGQARRTQQGAYQVALTEDSRGKVVIGDTTFLFQFVAPPPVQPRPQLPVSVTRGATSIDWPTTMIAAFSFLAHLMAIGLIYSDWLDPIIDENVNVQGLIDTVKNLPPPPPLEDPTPEDETPTETKDAKEPEKKTASAGQKAPGKAAGGGNMSAKEAAALSNELEQLEMQTLGALAGQGPATAGVLQDGEVTTDALDRAAASGAGVGTSGPGGLSIPGGGGPLRPGASGGGLGSIGATGKAGGEGSGTGGKVKGPTGSAAVGGAAVAGGNVSNASRVVAGMRAGFRACYQRGLAQNPDAQGSIRLSIRVGPGGEVQGVSASSSGNLPGSVVSCVQSRASAAQFSPPEGGSAVISVPVTFVKQN
ncbi:MAG: AgmX/PglI C-terminal domain-containing protein [Polyangiaceae bacterium]|nr:AgmX/PglI C-terminal domain-containing protein [Myxococcales bacterium]MCB9591024.1 AgmX/PglI C-terminal domain-containing protein [Polyangiaceae bacterium]MCB9605187.1 AgmX/PglI C-terminal domain-containing protein [Polyangiaceae bacterium]